MVTIALNKMHFPVTTLGPGRRVAIWFQGCRVRCAGCLSRDTWDVTDAHLTTVDHVAEALTPWLEEADGVTFSGGEPFDQPQALAALIGAVRRVSRPIDLLAYSGYGWDRLHRCHGAVTASQIGRGHV